RQMGTHDAPALAFDAELDILQALCYTATTLPLDQCRAALVSFTHPLLATIQQMLQDRRSLQKGALIHYVERLCIIFRYSKLDLAPTASHPVIELFQEAWPLLRQCVEAFPTSDQVSEAVARLYKHTVRNCP